MYKIVKFRRGVCGGFTLIEILIFGALMALVALSLAIFLPTGFQKSADLDSQGDKLIETLKIAQSNAKNRKEQNSWGVRLEDDSYILFKGPSYNPGQIFYL
ncbi:MAG: hypothetical protein Q8L57_03040, partial [bacterium]|nr:hypothetical protein [bacterium]